MPDANGRRRMKLTRQIAWRMIAVAVLFTIINIAIVVATYVFDEDMLAYDLVSIVADDAIEDFADGALDDPAESLPARIGLAVHDHAGQLILVNNPYGLTLPPVLPTGQPSSQTAWQKTEAGYHISGVRLADLNGTPVRISVAIEGEGVIPYLPAIGYEIAQHALAPLVPLTLLLLVLNVGVVARMLKPLTRAASDVDQLGPAMLGQRLSADGAPLEVEALVGAVNRALDRHEAALATLQSFSADAAHELRTPLAVMRLNIDQMPPGNARDQLLDDANNMTRLVNQMLDVASADALTLAADDIADLAAIARDVVTTITPLAISRRRSVSFHDEGAVGVRGKPEAISRALRNLVENALAHTPENSTVEVFAGPGSVLSVRDAGPGISVDQRDKVFQRFWRGDRRNQTGSGLGLSIVRSVMDAHAGSVTISDASKSGAVVTLRFPIS